MTDSFLNPGSIPITRLTDKGFTFSDAPDYEKFIKSVAFNEAAKTYEASRSLPNPCGESEISKINVELKKFFTVIKGIKAYGDLYINGSINKIQNITSLIRKTAQIISGVLKTLTNRLRDFLLDKIRKAIDAVADTLFPTIAKQFENTAIQAIIDQLFCAFKDIIANLVNLVIDFLQELVGKIVNVPFCVAEQFTNALVNNVAALIDNQIGPILDQIDNILGEVGSIVGSVFEALDFILGFDAFLCAAPNCPELTEFQASPWGGPSDAQKDSFANFAAVPTAEGIVGSVDEYISNIEIFGGTLGDAERPPSSITECDADAFRCGPPKVVIFGGGGVGAVGEVIVDNIGTTIGVDLLNQGTGYRTPPFVSFVDNCATSYTAGYTTIDDDGHVTEIVITNPGISPPIDGKDEFDYDGGGNVIIPPGGGDGTDSRGDSGIDSGGDSGIGSGGDGGIGSGGDGGIGGGGDGGIGGGGDGGNVIIPPGGGDGTDSRGDGGIGSGGDSGNDYIICLNGFLVENTGLGYTENDTITITPDVPGLDAKVTLTEFGQIVSIEITSDICGIPTYPDIIIDSPTGEGAVIKPILSFTRVLDSAPENPDLVLDTPITTLKGRTVFAESLKDQGFTRKSVVRVVDCVS